MEDDSDISFLAPCNHHTPSPSLIGGFDDEKLHVATVARLVFMAKLFGVCCVCLISLFYLRV